MKILVITNLFPNNKEPNRGVFNKQQMAELAKLCELEVAAPVTWHRAKEIAIEEVTRLQRWQRSKDDFFTKIVKDNIKAIEDIYSAQ